MAARSIKYAIYAALALLVAAGFYYMLRPEPVGVDVAHIKRQRLVVAVEEEGVTRIREVYQVSAPVGGKLKRSPREVGDAVEADKTVVAVIQPGDPSFLDVRSRRELLAAVAAARAAISLAEAEVRRAEAELAYAVAELNRAKSLMQTDAISQKSLDEAQMRYDTRLAGLASAKATLELRKREYESAQAKLIGPEDPGLQGADGSECCVQIKAPVDGQVLKILRESEQVVQPGTALVEIGDPRDLEIAADLLSSDAVKVRVGAPAWIDNWGGQGRLNARVSEIEPSGFKKVSALGIEEQRVKTILQLIDPPEKWRSLGHEFRVFVEIVIWQGDDVLAVPMSALFRVGDKWAVFKAVDGSARLAVVEIGQRNARLAEVKGGLAEGDVVIVHPSDRIEDGSDIAVREGGF